VGLTTIALMGGMAREARAETTSDLEYEVTEIKLPNFPFNEAISINNSGELIGMSGYIPIGQPCPMKPPPPPKSFFYKNGNLTDYSEIWAVAINDLGDILFTYGVDHQSLIYKLGEKIQLDFYGSAMNNKGEVVGEKYLYSGGQKIELIPTKWTKLLAINDNTVIAGLVYEATALEAFVLRNGVVIKLECPVFDPNNIPSSHEIYPYDINNKNQIVGGVTEYVYVPFSYRFYGCVWDENGKVKELGPERSIFYAINDKGQVVGTADYISFIYPEGYIDYKTKAILYQNKQVINLDDFLTENSPFLSLDKATDINNKGQIVGTGVTYTGWVGATYVIRTSAFILTPKPKPSPDLNEDGIVNLYDLSELAEHWLEER